MTVFDVFRESDYEYLEISRGEVFGNVIKKATPLRGIFKRRDSEESMQNMELPQSNATIHAHPEDFNNFNGIVGNGIRACGETYEIVNMTVGTNFDTGQVEHLTFTLQRASLVQNG